MGLGIAAATALLAIVVVAAGYNVAGTWFDVEGQLREARRVADNLQFDASQTTMSVTSLTHNSGSGHITLVVRNTGAISLEATDLDFLFNGRWYTGEDITITGQTGTLWHPGQSASFFFHGTVDLNSAFRPTAPTRATVVAANGAMAFWGT